MADLEATPAAEAQPADFGAEAAIDMADLEATPATEAQPADFGAEPAIDVTDLEATPVAEAQPAEFAEAAVDVAELEATPVAEAQSADFADAAVDVTDLAATPAAEAQPADFADAAIDVTDLAATPAAEAQPADFADAAIDVTDLEATPAAEAQPAEFEDAAVDVTDLEATPAAEAQPADFGAEAAIDMADLEAPPAAAPHPSALDAPPSGDLMEFEPAPAYAQLTATGAEPSIDVLDLEATPAAYAPQPSFEGEPAIDVSNLEATPAPYALQPAFGRGPVNDAGQEEDAEPILDLSPDAVVSVDEPGAPSFDVSLDESGPRTIEVSFDDSGEEAVPLESPADAISAQAQDRHAEIALPEPTDAFEITPTQLTGPQFTELSATDAPTEPFQTADLSEIATNPHAFSTPEQRAAAAAPQAPRWEIGWSDDARDLSAPPPDPAWAAAPTPLIELEPELIEEAVIEEAVIEPEPWVEAPSVDTATTQPMRAQVAALQALPSPANTRPVPIVDANDLVLRPSTALFPNDEGEVAFIEGEHRVIIHTVEGQVKRGVLRDVDLLDGIIPLEQQTGFAPERIPSNRVKAIFFMSLPGSRAPGVQGQKIRVTFRDGRQVAGFSEDYQRTAPGFFIIPADNRTNTARIFIFRASVQSVAEG
jgi:hypothetical protein